MIDDNVNSVEKSILIICPFDGIYPPKNGGAQRFFNVIHQVSKFFKVTLVIFQSKESFVESINEFPEIASINIFSVKEKVDEDRFFSFFPLRYKKALQYKWMCRNINAPTDSSFLQYYPSLVRLLRENQFDFVILEGLATINSVSVIRKLAPFTKIVYDAHNVDSVLAEKLGSSKSDIKLILKAESSLHKTVDAVFTCSDLDRKQFLKMNNNKIKVHVIPNGIQIGKMFDEGVFSHSLDFIIFCGSLWSLPNSEGLLWFYSSIFPLIKQEYPKIKLLVVGSGTITDSLKTMSNDTSVDFTGPVNNVNAWYNKAAIAIVPLLTGSGTRLKILEAMSFGLPVISTSKGAEGIDYSINKDIIIADTEIDFAKGVKRLLKNKEKRISIASNGRKLVEEKYDWNIIGTSIANSIKVILSRNEK